MECNFLTEIDLFGFVVVLKHLLWSLRKHQRNLWVRYDILWAVALRKMCKQTIKERFDYKIALSRALKWMESSKSEADYCRWSITKDGFHNKFDNQQKIQFISLVEVSRWRFSVWQLLISMHTHKQTKEEHKDTQRQRERGRESVRDKVREQTSDRLCLLFETITEQLTCPHKHTHH